MPFTQNTRTSPRICNLSDATFAKKFAGCYKFYKLDILYGRERQIAFIKFLRAMQNEYGYYQQNMPKLYACETYWQRLKPKNWSKDRILNWSYQDFIFFENITKNKQTRRKSRKKSKNKNKISQVSKEKIIWLRNTKMLMLIGLVSTLVTKNTIYNEI